MFSNGTIRSRGHHFHCNRLLIWSIPIPKIQLETIMVNTRGLCTLFFPFLAGTSHGHTSIHPQSRLSSKNNEARIKQTLISTRGGGVKNPEPDSYRVRNARLWHKAKSLPAAFGKWYMNQMESHELLTKCISAGFLALVGDVCAQELGHYLTSKNDQRFNNNNIHHTTSEGERFDKRRMFAMYCDGFFCTGPILHYVYEFYEKILPIEDESNLCDTDTMTPQQKSKAARKRFQAALLHVLFDNIFMAVFYVFAMMVVTSILEGRYDHLSHEIQNDFVPAVKASWVASLMGLAPMQLISFHFLPMELRVLAVNFQDVIWVMVMSWVTHRNRH